MQVFSSSRPSLQCIAWSYCLLHPRPISEGKAIIFASTNKYSQCPCARLIALTVACGYFGVFFVIPLRTYFIIRQRLVFPTPTATAFTIRSLHSGPQGEVIAKLKAKALAATMSLCFCYKVLNGYIPGIFLDWHIGWTLHQIGWKEGKLYTPF
jgi:hypothetical protein